MKNLSDISIINKNSIMPEIDIELIADAGLFKGLANQNMLFHQCICEIVDNSIAQQIEGKPFKIDIIFEKVKDNDNYYVYIVDNCRGMSTEILGKAMQPGESATIDNRLNEHGFGLKHSLATLTKKTGSWKIWTKDLKKGNISSVHSPFQHKMKIKDDDSFPPIPIDLNDISTIVKAEITLKYFQSVQISRGAKSTVISKLIELLIEHLGVTYRGFLSQNPNTLEIDGMIRVTLDNSTQKVPPIEIPVESTKDYIIPVNIEGKNYDLEYRTGLINETKRNQYLTNRGLRLYYQGNLDTQGIDIRLGKRVIATKQLQNIFDKKPHNKYNIFLAELLIPELPRNILKTVNNKTDIDFDDQDWLKIFEILAKEYPIPEDPRFAEEEKLRNQWIKKLKSVEANDEVLSDVSVWFSGVKIDVYRKKHDTNAIIVYELKAGVGEPLDLYQLKMYWDGLVMEKRYPSEGILICEKFDSKLKNMADKMNLMTHEKDAKPYNFSIKTIEELELIKPPSRKNKS